MYAKVLFFLFLFFNSLSVCSQMGCSLEGLSDAPEVYESLSGLRSTQNSIRRIAILPTLFHLENSVASFGDKEIKELIARANTYFSPIGYQFYIVDEGLRHIYDNSYYDMTIDDVDVVRELYNKDNAINLYFVHSLKNADGRLLNGLASLPSLKRNRNSIFISYLEPDGLYLDVLKDKVFPHELGHYFGLLHTFEHSNSEIIAKRELVTRGEGANCTVAGDYLCDTAADPSERYDSIVDLDCGKTSPDSIRDAWGLQYTPPTDNIMSYNVACGNVFTKQQYQRMQAAGSIRFSPSAEYQIVSYDRPFISISGLGKRVFCSGELVSLDFSTHQFENINNDAFDIQLVDDYDNVSVLPSQKVEDKLKIQLPPDLEAHLSYRLRVGVESQDLWSPWTQHFEVKNAGTAYLSNSQQIINKGDSARLFIALTGSAPWLIELSDGTQLEEHKSSQLTLTKTPAESTNYSIAKVSNACGSFPTSGSVNVTVVPPQLSVASSEGLQSCEKSTVQLQVGGLKNPITSYYRVVLRSSKQYLIVPELVEQNQIKFKLPTEIEGAERVSVQVKGEGLGNFTEPLELSIKPSPPQPIIAPELSFCKSSRPITLKASIIEGNEERWYNAANEYLGFHPDLALDSVGFENYFVSQIASNGCESEKSRTTVEVKGTPVATITGSQQVFQGDSARLRISFLGNGPFDVAINNGSHYEVDASSFTFFTQPENSFSYEIEEVKNECGIGVGLGRAQVELLKVLSSSIPEDGQPSFYPNPNRGNFMIKSGVALEQVYNLRGVRVSTIKTASDFFTINQKGTFILKLRSETNEVFYKKMLVY